MRFQGPLAALVASIALIAASQGFGGVAHPRAAIARRVFQVSILLMAVVLLAVLAH